MAGPDATHSPRSPGSRVVAAVFAVAFVLSSGASRAEQSPAATDGHPSSQAPGRRAQIQYGVAFTVEGVASAGPVCSDTKDPCILGSGGGIAARVGWRPSESLYVGGAYEFSKQDPNQLYRLGILQQARAELRDYFRTGKSVTPFALLGLGLAGYGNEWLVDTWGPGGALGGGLEVELSGGAVLGVSLAYRPIYLQSFVDSSTISHDAGVAHFIGLELALEAQDTL